MNLHENSPLGRKVFFVYPPYYVTNQVIPRLSSEEYEVYTLDNYQLIKPILKKFPDSICFFNIDADDLTYTEWFRFLKSFEEDEVLSTIFFGVVCQHAPKIHREHFLSDIQLPAGFIQYIPDVASLTEKFVKILELNGAMGKRRYIRAECGFDRSIYVELDIRGQRIPMMIQNISSVGVSCYINGAYLPIIQDNQAYRAQINLNGAIFSGSLIVLTKREVNGKHIIVLLFSQGLSFSSKNIIRDFIRNKTQETLMRSMEGVPLDSRDYSDNSEEAIRERESAPALEAADSAENEKSDENKDAEAPEELSEETETNESEADGEAEQKNEETPDGTKEAPSESSTAEESQESAETPEDSEKPSE